MNIEKVEKKFKASFRLGTPRECGNSGFILSDGSVMPILGHERACQDVGCKLAEVLEAGVCRYMFRVGQQGNVAAFEYSMLTPEQKTAIRGILKADDYYTVVTTKTMIDRVRPIRSIQF